MSNISQAALWSGILVLSAIGAPIPLATQPIPSPLSTAVTGSAAGRIRAPWTSLANPASASVAPTVLAAWFLPTPFGLIQLNRAGIIATSQFDSTGFAISLAGTSAESFSSVRTALIVARQITPALSVGVAMHLDCQSVSGYGTSALGWLTAGLLLRPSDELCVGIVADNLTGSRRGAEASQMIAIGAALQLGDSMVMSIGLDQRSRQPVGASVGLSWRAVQHCELGADMSLAPVSLGGGLTLDLDSLQVEIGCRFVEPLGFQTAVGVSVGVPARWNDDESVPLMESR